jgi:oxalate decarboxylase/phosphoglucose isomerase-like protein (cupin superfamily)
MGKQLTLEDAVVYHNTFGLEFVIENGEVASIGIHTEKSGIEVFIPVDGEVF